MHLMAIEAEETSIPVEWVDADEWEVIEQAFATATSHSARVDSRACCTENEQLANRVTATLEHEQNTVLKVACIDTVVSKTDGEGLATEASGSSGLSNFQLDALNTNLESVDVKNETVVEILNQEVLDGHTKRLRRTLPSWAQKSVREPKTHVQASQSEVKIKENQVEEKSTVVQTNISKLTNPWLIGRPGCGDNLHSKALYLQFKGRLVYSKTHSEVDAAVHDIWEMINSKRSLVEGNVAVGFDVEWKTSFRRDVGSGKVAVIQLCLDYSRCDVMHIIYSGIPSSLYAILEDPTILKTGVGIHGDVSKLQRDYKLKIQGVVNLSEIANQKLGRWQSWSLSSLSQALTCKQVEKVPNIRCGDWEACPLSPPQLQYAATDAFASLYLYQILESFPSRIC